MTKIISIAAAPYDGSKYETRDGDSGLDFRHILYAVTEDGKLYSKVSGCDDWEEEKGPA
jgi:hypothetical protein